MGFCKKGQLAPWAQATVWALVQVDKNRELWLTDGEIASMVTKVGGGSPNAWSISKWRKVFENDKCWYPGKTTAEGERPGPKKLLNGQKANAIAQAAMAVKRAGTEPSVADVRERCPDAVLNPKTNAPFTDKYILQVFRERCYDEGAEEYWDQHNPLQKTALPDWLKQMRLTWGQVELQKGVGGGWFARHCVWVDPCYNILSTSQRQIFDQQRANAGKGKRWMSHDKRHYSRNQRSSPYAGKQRQFGDRKIWWFIVLARGQVHVEIMGSGWRQTGVGMSKFMARLQQILTDMVDDGDTLPRVVCSDRGPGFYQTSTGHITKDYAQALHQHGFRAFAGADASKQPPDLPDLLLHETAVAWIKGYLKKHPFSRRGSLDQQQVKLEKVLRDCTAFINANYDVQGLCYSFPQRLQKMVDKKGDRLKH